MVLANGGRFELIAALLTEIEQCGWPFAVAHSRDHRGSVLDAGADRLDEFDVEHVELETLLSLLQLRYKKASGVRSGSLEQQGGQTTVSDLVDLRERSGFLFAAFDARGWDLKRYRAYVLARDTLHLLGLEPRRIVLLSPPRRLAKRARLDDIETRELSEIGAWRQEVDNGKAFSGAARMPLVPPDAHASYESAEWTGPRWWRSWVSSQAQLCKPYFSTNPRVSECSTTPKALAAPGLPDL